MNFDPVAPFFRPLEYLVFQGSMQAARCRFADEAEKARRVLIAGEGDGRTLEALLSRNPDLEVEVVDSSERMVARAQKRLAGKGIDTSRVTWRQEDIRDQAWEEGRFDLLVTPFFLDCFDEAGLAKVMKTLGPALELEGRWLQMDFSPPRGSFLRRWRARFWLGILHGFFRLSTGLEARTLVDPGPHFASLGLRRERRASFRAGLIHAEVWRRFT